ncbi:competence protein ComEA [Ligilactobacillus sp. WC1T17]|uniref:Competence protein ComEA n=1 Tax=Ligilactobacillus ruminis TaxID=1623 RepID=A0ABY1ABR5_9LACO|nr:competence protein ComEA [Ligilactobacillus ruminis]
MAFFDELRMWLEEHQKLLIIGTLVLLLGGGVFVWQSSNIFLKNDTQNLVKAKKQAVSLSESSSASFSSSSSSYIYVDVKGAVVHPRRL